MRLIDVDAEIRKIEEEIKRSYRAIDRWRSGGMPGSSLYDIEPKVERIERNIMECRKEIRMLRSYATVADKPQWIPISERLPEDESYILVSFENYTMSDIARYEENDEGGTFYPGDDEKSYSTYGLFVNAWMPLPEPYREEQ